MLKELTHYTFNVCQNANLINNKEGTRRKIILKKNIKSKEFFREESVIESKREREREMELQMGKM